MISKTGMHAVLALAKLAQVPEGTFVGTAEIAEEIRAPRNYLGKLLQLLAEEGILVSQKGKGGGFRLARDAASICLFDVIEPIERVSRWNGCFLGRARCSDKRPCAIHQRWKTVRDSYLGFLRDTSIEEVASS